QERTQGAAPGECALTLPQLLRPPGCLHLSAQQLARSRVEARTAFQVSPVHRVLVSGVPGVLVPALLVRAAGERYPARGALSPRSTSFDGLGRAAGSLARCRQ